MWGEARGQEKFIKRSKKRRKSKKIKKPACGKRY
jgi:hypothetical protein